MSVFSDIYRNNRWNGVESLSGPGSGYASTLRLRPLIRDLVERLGVESVLDVGCGDGFWLPDLPGYLGVDVAPEAVEMSRATHPHRSYQVIEPFAPLPPVDLVLCRDVIQHQSVDDAVGLVESIRRSGSSWLLASTYVGGQVESIPTGERAWHPDLSLPMFGLGEPVELIPDGYDWNDPDRVKDPSKHLGLWRLG